jgi:hypothetical protein
LVLLWLCYQCHWLSSTRQAELQSPESLRYSCLHRSKSFKRLQRVMPKRNALQATISNRLMKRQGTTASCTAQSKDFKETSSLHCQKRLFSQRSHTSQEKNWACWSNLKHGGLQVCLQGMSCVSKTCAQVTATQGRVEAAKKCCLTTY